MCVRSLYLRPLDPSLLKAMPGSDWIVRDDIYEDSEINYISDTERELVLLKGHLLTVGFMIILANSKETEENKAKVCN